MRETGAFVFGQLVTSPADSYICNQKHNRHRRAMKTLRERNLFVPPRYGSGLFRMISTRAATWIVNYLIMFFFAQRMQLKKRTSAFMFLKCLVGNSTKNEIIVGGNP
jgi:hypothetical protein